MTTPVRFLALACLLLACAFVPGATRTALHQADAQAFLNGVLDRQSFPPEAVARLEEGADAQPARRGCDTERLRSVAALRFHQWQQGDATRQGELIGPLRSAIGALLRCTPTLGFWWLVLADLDLADPERRAEGLANLRMSWLASPREGWIGIMRSRVAMSHVAHLTPADRDRVTLETRALLTAGITEAAEALLRHESPAIRNWAATLVSELEPGARNTALRRLARAGIGDIWDPVSPRARPGDGSDVAPILRLQPAQPARSDP